MKNYLTAILILLSAGLFSCQKEVDNVLPGSSNPGGTGAKRLVKMISKTGTDSSVAQITYNSAGKITGYYVNGTDSGQDYDLSLTYVRNSSGIIQKQILKNSDFGSLGIDSIVSVVNYDASSKLYKSAVTVVSIFGLPLADSIVFQYDGAGKLLREIDYSNVGFGYAPSSKTEYSYAGNNLASEKFYSYDDATKTYSLEETDTYEYDAKVNPLQFSSEAPVLNMNPFYSANNIVKTTGVASDPANNFVSTDSYAYNSSNLPISSTSVSGSAVMTTTYFYQ